MNTLHVAAIMDGNGRWATRRGLPRGAGHRAGAKAVRRIVDAAPSLGITTLSLYALSSDNFGRPASEVSMLLRLFAEYLEREGEALAKAGVRLDVVGRRDRLTPALHDAVVAAERLTADATPHGERLHMRLAIDYSARAELRRAAEAKTLGTDACPGVGPDVDLLIRTGGEQRLSDFMLWECAYAELWFTDRMWPDMTRAQLAVAVEAYRSRDRRYGRLVMESAS